MHPVCFLYFIKAPLFVVIASVK